MHNTRCQQECTHEWVATAAFMCGIVREGWAESSRDRCSQRAGGAAAQLTRSLNTAHHRHMTFVTYYRRSVMCPTPPPLSTPNLMPSTPRTVARTVRPCAKANTYPIIIPGDICDGCLLLLRSPLILSPSHSLTPRSLTIDRLKGMLLKVPLGKELLLEAEVELKVYLLGAHHIRSLTGQRTHADGSQYDL